jgi:hypothetical protein
MLISPIANTLYHIPSSNLITNQKTYYFTDISFNFYKELKKDDENEHDENSENEHDENSENNCLISNLPLDETCITLECNHKFNYYYIFNEILTSKKICNYMTKKLNTNQIKCPYCRTIYNYVLPISLDIEGTHKHIGVNYPTHSVLNIKCKEYNCEENNVFVTPLGYYCKTHYKKIKLSHKKKLCFTENKALKEPIKMKEKDNDINENWNSSIWNHYTIDKLKIILKENNLKVSGKKAILITRLMNNNIVPIPT